MGRLRTAELRRGRLRSVASHPTPPRSDYVVFGRDNIVLTENYVEQNYVEPHDVVLGHPGRTRGDYVVDRTDNIVPTTYYVGL